MVRYFYPRSPCGERPQDLIAKELALAFLSTLSLRRATILHMGRSLAQLFLSTLSLRRATLPPTDRIFFFVYFYPRSPCGERLVHYDNYNLHCVISIHALLAESDILPGRLGFLIFHFYPRSPCGERPTQKKNQPGKSNISIHALLAESDTKSDQGASNQRISIHALLAESDPKQSIHHKSGQ